MRLLVIYSPAVPPLPCVLAQPLWDTLPTVSRILDTVGSVSHSRSRRGERGEPTQNDALPAVPSTHLLWH